MLKNRDLSTDDEKNNDLTWREQEVLSLLSERMTNREIADRLHLAESTVKDYVGKILSKLYVKNRREAVDRARTLGILDTDSKIVDKLTSNLPKEMTPFIGRVDELIKIKNVLEKSRLVSLTGIGGIGKTRLALKVAEEVTGDFQDGSFFVSLAPIRSAEHIVQTISESIGFPISTHEQPKAQLLRYLKRKQLLLVMDNYEHLLEGVDIFSEILQIAPGVKILATSREKLNLRSETNFNVGGMVIPVQMGVPITAKSDAITLFILSARKVHHDYDPSRSQIEQIANICRIVEGMPLAIELAASWLNILSEDEIADELEKGIDILSADLRDVPDRHRSLRAVFDHSWFLLNSSEQEVFMFLSVFRGGFTLEAAQDVAQASLKRLAGLVNKSLINYNLKSGRFDIHELLRQYAQDWLESTPEARDLAQEAHATYYAKFMKHRWQRLRGKNQLLALREIEDDITNVRAAWGYCVGQADAEQIRMFLHSFWFIHLVRGWNHAAVELFGEAVDALNPKSNHEESLSVKALAMGLQGYFMAWLGLSEQGYALSLESVKILEQLERPLDLAKVLEALSLNAYYLARLEDEENSMRKIYKIATEFNDDWLQAYSLFLWSLIDIRGQYFDQARQHANSSLWLFEEMNDTFSSAWPLLSLGGVSLAERAYEEARSYFTRCLRISEEFGFRWLMENASKYLGKISLSVNEIEEAENSLSKSMVIAQEIGLGREKANLLYEFALVRDNQNRKEQAVELLSLVLKMPESKLARIEGGSIQDKCIKLLAKIENEISKEAYSAAVKNGQELNLDEVFIELTH